MHRSTSSGPRALAVALLLLLLLPATVSAHAKVVASTPADGATLPEPPTSVSVTFDEEIGPDSHFEVVDAAGQTVGTGKLSAGDAKTMTGAFAPASGSYEVRWTAASIDGDIARGIIRFTDVPSTSAPTGTPGSSATVAPTAAAPSASPTPSPTPAPSGGGAGMLIPIAGLVVIVGVGFALLRGRQGRP